jgi:hypothetical protein
MEPYLPRDLINQLLATLESSELCLSPFYDILSHNNCHNERPTSSRQQGEGGSVETPWRDTETRLPSSLELEGEHCAPTPSARNI